MSAKPLKDGTSRPSVFNSILMEPTIIAHVCKYSISFLSMQMKNGVNTRQLYALPPGRRRAAAALAARQPTLPRPHHPESGQARVHSSERPLASLERPLRLQSRQLGSSPLGTFAAQGTSALTATRRRDCGRRSRPQTRSSPRTNGLPAAPVCSRPAPCPRT